MPRSEQINELAAALAIAQGAMSVAIKDSTNPHFRSKYADLSSVIDAVRPHLSANGICFVQEPTTEAGMVVVETTLYHKSGQWMSSKLSVACKDLSPQPVGSATTYARRYALMAICGIAPAEDDDGEAAQGRTQPMRPAPKPTPPPIEPKAAPADALPEQSADEKRINTVRATITALSIGQDDPRGKQVMPIIRKYCAMNDKKIASVPADDYALALLLEALRNIK